MTTIPGSTEQGVSFSSSSLLTFSTGA